MQAKFAAAFDNTQDGVLTINDVDLYAIKKSKPKRAP